MNLVFSIIISVFVIINSVELFARGKDLPYGYLKEFISDGCTFGGSGPDGSPELWTDCCVRHDWRYWQGGTRLAREYADRELAKCVASKGYADEGEKMYQNLRRFGSPYVPDPYRWGNGWPLPRGYTPLNETEQNLVEQLSPLEMLANPSVNTD